MISMMLVFPADENKREVRLFVEGRNIEELFKDITRAVTKYRWDSPDPYFAVTVRTDRLYNGYPVTIEYGGTSREVGWLKEGLLDEAERGTKGVWDCATCRRKFHSVRNRLRDDCRNVRGHRAER